MTAHPDPLHSETLAAIAERYSCRAYTDEPVDPAVLRAIAEAGVRAPSAMNRQPWRVVLVSDKALIDEIGAVGLENLRAADPGSHQRILDRGGHLLYNAPAMVIVAQQPQPGRFPADLDVGIVLSHLALAATSLGIASCICGLAGLGFEGEAAEPLKERLGFPAGFEFGGSILLGHATGTGTPHPPAFDKLIEVTA